MSTKILGGAIAAALTLVSSAAVAQQAPVVVEQPASAGKVLKQGTSINLATLAELSSRENKKGDRIEMRVVDPVLVDGITVIPAGTRAVGEVTVRSKKGMWGKSGKLEFRPLFIKLGDRQVAVSAQNTTRDKGKAGTAGVVAAVAFLPIAGFFVTGTSAVIPAGTPVAAELDEDLPVVVSSK